jgi:hypothetical protein
MNAELLMQLSTDADQVDEKVDIVEPRYTRILAPASVYSIILPKKKPKVRNRQKTRQADCLTAIAKFLFEFQCRCCRLCSTSAMLLTSLIFHVVMSNQACRVAVDSFRLRDSELAIRDSAIAPSDLASSDLAAVATLGCGQPASQPHARTLGPDVGQADCAVAQLGSSHVCSCTVIPMM